MKTYYKVSALPDTLFVCRDKHLAQTVADLLVRMGYGCGIEEIISK